MCKGCDGVYNYVLMRLDCAAVFRLACAAGTCVAGALGVALGILEHSAVGMFGGAFLGLLVGLIVGLTALACAAVFNVLAPFVGGVAVRLEPAGEQADKAATMPPGEDPGD